MARDDGSQSPAWRALLPAAAVAALILAAVGVTLAVRGDEPAPRRLEVLRLTAGGAARTDAAMEPAVVGPPPVYRLTGPLPDLGSTAPVARLAAGDLDEARAARMAGALGLDAPVRRTDDGFVVAGDAGTLTVSRSASQVTVSFSEGRPGATEPARPGTGSGDGAAVPGCDPAAGPCPDEPVEAPAEPPPPRALPDPAGAERIARDLLDRMGVDATGWTVEVIDADTAVACSPGTRCDPAPSVVFQRTVTLTPTFDGIETTGLEWGVTVGDEGRVLGLWGTLTELEPLGAYPLRTTTRAFEDLQAGRDVVGGVVAFAERAAGGPEPAIEPPPAPRDVEVSGVRLRRMVITRAGDGTALLVPVYEFLSPDRHPVAAVVAVAPDLVQLEVPPAKQPLPAPEPRPVEPGTKEPGTEEPPVGILPAPGPGTDGADPAR
jgi:hypothetical protein